ncbi:MAG: FG-GAP repeat protein [Sideroxydans sp.]|nr:FG-GAP repeat protein [Sideroxydans sp.]
MSARLLHGFLLACLGACIFNGAAMAEEDWVDYAPLFSPEQARPVQLSACTLETISGFVLNTDTPISAHCGEHDITVSGNSKARKQKEDEEQDATHVVVSLKVRQQKTSKVVFRADDFPAEFVDSVAFADLNGDGKDDFILNLSSHGVGLAAEFTGTLYLLSSATGYRYLTLSGMNHVPRYLRFGNSPQAVLVLQRMGGRDSEGAWIRALDKKPHLFFVFDLLQFDAAAAKGAKLNNSLDARFPFWTLFTNEPSHAETTLLTQAMKKTLWDDPLRHAVSGRLVEH